MHTGGSQGLAFLIIRMAGCLLIRRCKIYLALSPVMQRPRRRSGHYMKQYLADCLIVPMSMLNTLAACIHLDTKIGK